MTESVKIGEVMRAAGIGIVQEAGPGSKYSSGDVVYGMFGVYLVFAFVLGFSEQRLNFYDRFCIIGGTFEAVVHVLDTH